MTNTHSKNETHLNANSIDKLTVVSSFFPIGEFVSKVGGGIIDSSLLVPIGVEPHDFEPTIKQLQAVNSADVLVYNGLGIENWIKKIDIPKIDASKDLNASYTDKRNISLDPHIWLDPLRAKEEVRNIRDGLAKINPSNKQDYFDNAKIFSMDLDKLDSKIRTELADCKKRDFISFHNSFSYFAKRYGLNQHSISGSGPQMEFTPTRLAEIIDLAKNLDLHIIYSEELVDPRYASVIAEEIPNGKVLPLSPIEGLTKKEQNDGVSYIDKMNENIKNLMAGLECNK